MNGVEDYKINHGVLVICEILELLKDNYFGCLPDNVEDGTSHLTIFTNDILSIKVLNISLSNITINDNTIKGNDVSFVLNVPEKMQSREITAEIECSKEEMFPAIMLVTDMEHDFPEQIGVNELTDSIVVGMNFTK